MTAAAAIEAILERSGLTKAELSARSGVSRALIDDYLKGRRQPAVAQLERLGEAAGLRLDIAWGPEVELDVDPSWNMPANPEMADPPTTMTERADLLARVIPIGMALRRRAAEELEFPPFRTLRRR